MKFQFLRLVFLSMVFGACSGNRAESTQSEVVLTDASIDSIPTVSNRERPLPPIPYSQVMKTKPFTGKVASKDDVQKNGAIFSFSPPKGNVQTALPLKMPLMVFWGRHPNRDTILFVIQCERLGSDTMVGWVNGWGKSGMTPLRELIHAQEQRRIDERDFFKK